MSQTRFEKNQKRKVATPSPKMHDPADILKAYGIVSVPSHVSAEELLEISSDDSSCGIVHSQGSKLRSTLVQQDSQQSTQKSAKKCEKNSQSSSPGLASSSSVPVTIYADWARKCLVRIKDGGIELAQMRPGPTLPGMAVGFFFWRRH